MAVVDNVSLERVNNRAAGPWDFLIDIDFNERLIQETKETIREDVWRWYMKNREEEILTVRVAVFFSHTVHMKDIEHVIGWIVGEKPEPLEEET